MKLLVFTPDYPTEADPVPGLFVQHTMQALAQSGHDVRIIHFGRATKASIGIGKRRLRSYKTITHESARHCEFLWPRWRLFQRWEPLVVGRTLSRFASRCIPDLEDRIVFSQWLLPTAEATLPLAMARRLRFAGIARGSDLQNLGTARRRERLARTLDRLPTLMANGEWAREELRKNGFHASAERVVVARNIRRLPDPASPRSPWGLGQRFRIVCTGSLVPRKGIDTLLLALSRLKIRFRLSVFGTGPQLEELKTLAATLGIGHDVEWHGRRPNEEVLQATANADLFVLASRREGVPNAVLEALALATPTISTRVDGIPELVINGVTGWLVPPDSPGDLASAIETAHGSPERALALGRQGMEHVRALYDPGVCLAALEGALANTSRTGCSFGC